MTTTDEDVGMQAARWRRLDTDLRAKVEEFERHREAWHSSKTSAQALHFASRMNDLAVDIAGYVALALQVRP